MLLGAPSTGQADHIYQRPLDEYCCEVRGKSFYDQSNLIQHKTNVHEKQKDHWKPSSKFFKPLSSGWVREVIYDKKEDGSLYSKAKEVIYHAPMQSGTKPRTFKSQAELKPFRKIYYFSENLKKTQEMKNPFSFTSLTFFKNFRSTM